MSVSARDMLTWQPARRPEVAWRVIDGEAVVVNPRAGLVFPLNPVATRCWELADGTRAIESIIQTILEEFDADPQAVEADVVRFFQEVAEKGLVVADENVGAGA